MKKRNQIIILAFSLILILVSVLFLRPQNGEIIISEEQMKELVDCLKEEGVVIYGSSTCPACRSLEEEFKGREVIAPIYTDCYEYQEKCAEEMKTGYVPEIQIKGELFDRWGSPEVLAKEVNCRVW